MCSLVIYVLNIPFMFFVAQNLVFAESVTELKTDAKSTPEAGVPEVEETCATKTTCSAPKDEL